MWDGSRPTVMENGREIHCVLVQAFSRSPTVLCWKGCAREGAESSVSQVESYTSNNETTWVSSEPTVDDWLGTEEPQHNTVIPLSKGDVDHDNISSLCSTYDEFLDKDRNATYTANMPSIDVRKDFHDFNNENEYSDHAFQAVTEMLCIRLIIIEKIRSSIVRREIDYEAPSDGYVSSIYDILQKNLPSLEKIQIYYSNRRIKRRTDLTKLPAGDRRQFFQLAGTQGSLIFVVASPSVRIF
ncbi:hypothetical protein GCK32_008669 [Trichostrongylus colubriformis]|uniref:Uncharacterized protein n=1 Tax=Trichostrongylus colubriformis TaxID=6319 RepID=A0AAN8F027_TRICO